MNKEKNKSKCLYACKSIITDDEYKKMVKYFPRLYWVYVIYMTIINLIITTIIAVISKNLIASVIFFIIYQIYIMILIKIRLGHYAEKSFNYMIKKEKIDTEINNEFYDDYFVRKSEKGTIKINYNYIDKSIETGTNFYLRFSKRNMVIIIQKSSCDLDLINFIRDKFKNLENHIGDNSKFKGTKKYNNPNFIKIFMIILFVITLCSLLGASWSVNLANKINPQHGFNFIKNNWVFWCWLPIPILSIILGYKYRRVGFKCTKNIVGGFIIGILLLLYGFFILFPTYEEDYNKLFDYKKIIDADLPLDGELEIQNWKTYFDEDKTDYTLINAYYDKVKNVDDLEASIVSNNNWLLSKDIKSELKIFMPSQLKTNDDAYFSIYNKTINEYNTVPNTSGTYEIYVMKYDISDKKLEIHKFNYLYK